MFHRAFVPIVVLAATCWLVPVMSDAAEAILGMALQPDDMPVAARSESPTLISDAEEFEALAPYGVSEGVDYWYEWPIDGAGESSDESLPHGWQLSGQVLLAADERDARRLFELGKRAGGLNSSHLGEGTRILDLPRYGDEQFARLTRRASPEALVLVRKGALVWEIIVQPTLAFKPTEAQQVAELETYAVKQQARINER